ncbi:MAG: substrate-binding domain-containing protein [Nocardioides sp.]
MSEYPKFEPDGLGGYRPRATGGHRARGLGRFSRPWRYLPWAAAIVVLLLIGGFLIADLAKPDDRPSNPGASPCPVGKATIATTSAMAVPLRRALAESTCTNVSVRGMRPDAVAKAVSSGVNVPDYWIPDFSIWVDQFAAATGTAPEEVLASIASTPVVLVSTSDPPVTWADALTRPELLLGDPRAEGSGITPLALASAGTSEVELMMAIAGQAQRKGITGADPPPEVDRVKAIDQAGVGHTAVTEQAFLASGSKLKAAVPQPGTWALDYPLVRVAPETRAEDLGATTTWLTNLVTAPSFRANLAASHFRPPVGVEDVPLAGGVGKVRPLPAPPVSGIGKLLGAWTELGVPSRTLALVDVSGSMDFASEGGTRIDLTVAAMRGGLDLFPDSFEVGVWAFSERLGGADQDYRRLVPVRRLDAVVDGDTQRDLLTRGLVALPSLTNGGTGLYDSTLTAYRQARASYDPKKANNLLIFSDGANDDPGSITLPRLVSRLKQLADPKRPVTIIAIGISADADVDALSAIAKATKGFAFVARRPEDIGKAFEQAMVARLQ